MPAPKGPSVARVVFPLALMFVGWASQAAAQPLQILHSFTACLPSGECAVSNDGSHPNGALVRGSDDNLYGTASGGAGGAYGSIFRINSVDGTYTVLHRFAHFGGSFTFGDGCVPAGRLAEGPDGAFYGVASGCGTTGDGTIFKITTAGQFTKVHDLDDGDPATFGLSAAGLTRGADDNFYGTTRVGGQFGRGSVFRVTPAGVFTTLHSFNGTDGQWPITDLALAADGTLYGTTSAGALGEPNCFEGCGTIFSVATTGSLATVHEMTPEEGWSPSGVIQGPGGHLYGTVTSSFTSGPAVFSVTAAGVFTTIAALSPTIASWPSGGLAMGLDGNFYGVGSGGFLNVGTIFRLTPAGVVTTVHTFTGPDGSRPTAALALGPGGLLYGSTYQGGTEDLGTLFRILPVAPTHAILDVNILGTGSVTSVPTGIGCANACWASYPIGTEVTLDAVPAPGATFHGWFGCSASAGTACTVTVTANTTVFAFFDAVGAPAALLAPGAVTFEIQRVGTQSVAEKVVQLTNTGTARLQFGAFNGGPPTPAFSLYEGDYQVTTNCPLAFGLPAGDSCQFTFRFRPTSTGPRDTTLFLFFPGISQSHSISLTGRGYLVDENTVWQLVVNGGSRLQALQNLDGGWYFNVGDTHCGLGPGVSCPNTIGVTGLGLLAKYRRTGDQSARDAAWRAGDLLVQKFDQAMLLVPPGLPKLQDVEFLKVLSENSFEDPIRQQVYYETAYNWFGALAAQFSAAARVDALVTSRAAGGRRAVAVWDSASLVRAAKAVGYPEYAQAAAARIVERELEWKDTDPSHRWDVCVTPGGCGTPGNLYAFDDTLRAMGSLLWGIHDIPGFDAQIVQYRAHLLASQDPHGSWDAGDSQTTAYVMFGLAAVGGPGTAAAIRKAADFFIVNELPTGGWPSDVSPTGTGVENTEVDAEIVRGLSTLFSTWAGSDVLVAPSQLVTVQFTTVSVSGETTMVTSNPATVPATGGFQIYDNLMYEISTSATISGDITVCFYLPWIPDLATFEAARILHGENGVLVDRTIMAGPLAPDFFSRRMCALVSSLSPFAVGIDRTPPKLTVTLTPRVLKGNSRKLVTITATIRVRDAKDPSPAITLLSITSSDADAGLNKKDLPGDIQEARVGTDDRKFKLREESFGKRPTRTYTIVYRATDRSGNHRDVTAYVRVKGEK